jgi:hypothetical protein
VAPRQHAGLSLEYWRRFSTAQQVLSIAVELQRALGWLQQGDMGTARPAFERALNLIRLTVGLTERRSLRRELLRLCEVVAGFYAAAEPDVAECAHACACCAALSAEGYAMLHPRR